MRKICGAKFWDAGTQPEAEAVLVQGPALGWECWSAGLGFQTSTAAQIWAISAQSSAAPRKFGFTVLE